MPDSYSNDGVDKTVIHLILPTFLYYFSIMISVAKIMISVAKSDKIYNSCPNTIGTKTLINSTVLP